MKIALQALSPVHVWNGSSISPYADFIIQGRDVCYMDTYKIDNLIAQKRNMTEAYVDILRNKSFNAKEKFNMKSFLKKYGINFEKYIRFRIKLMSTENAREGVEIKEVIKTCERPYIPGSSIKGAIRTAVLWDYMKSKGYNFNNIKHMLYNKKQFYYTGEDVTRKAKINVQSDVFKFLQVTDTTNIGIENMQVCSEILIDLSKSHSQLKSKTNIPTLSECIPEGTKLEFRIKFKAREVDHVASEFGFLKNGDITQLFDKVNMFYKSNIERYVRNLENSDKMGFSPIISKYTEYLNIIKELLIKKNGFIIRLGSHKNVYDNTINSVLKHDEMEVVKKYIAKKKYIPNKIFPKTDWFIVDNNVVKGTAGWMIGKLC